MVEREVGVREEGEVFVLLTSVRWEKCKMKA
jgi:hypothetical protein